MSGITLMSSRLSLLVDLSSMLSREVDLDRLLDIACERLADALDAERATIWLVDAARGDLAAKVAILPELDGLRIPLGKGVAGYVAKTGEVVRLDDASADPRFDATIDKATGFSTRSMLVVPMRETALGPVRGVVQLLNRRQGPFDGDDERYLGALAAQLGRALALTTLRAHDSSEPGLVMRGPINRIVGTSPALAPVYERVARAARTDATVLLHGETGTGKGLFARAIHVNSKRQSLPFVTVDCTTLPRELVESELFGHERGAFTGADRRIVGRVELAEGGTLFLDEIGDFPLDLQGKLLRFLQDRTFERVGGREVLRADVRIVCATHRDLAEEVAKGRFREDLYFRARVVEIELPPLRARGADEVEALARHFVDVYAARYGVARPKIDPETLHAICRHPWPGNVRELEHWIESAVVLCDGGLITGDSLTLPRRTPGLVDREAVPIAHGMTLEAAMDAYIDATVRHHDGNQSTAARILGVGRNTVARALRRVRSNGE
jgi:transcriptional regulator with GAF, ATPase, and Fis domain